MMDKIYWLNHQLTSKHSSFLQYSVYSYNDRTVVLVKRIHLTDHNGTSPLWSFFVLWLPVPVHHRPQTVHRLLSRSIFLWFTSHRFDSRKKQNTKKYHLLYYPSYICFNFVHACHCGSSSVAFTQKATILQYSNPASYHIISYQQTNKQARSSSTTTYNAIVVIYTYCTVTSVL